MHDAAAAARLLYVHAREIVVDSLCRRIRCKITEKRAPEAARKTDSDYLPVGEALLAASSVNLAGCNLAGEHPLRPNLRTVYQRIQFLTSARTCEPDAARHDALLVYLRRISRIFGFPGVLRAFGDDAIYKNYESPTQYRAAVVFLLLFFFGLQRQQARATCALFSCFFFSYYKLIPKI